MLVKVFDRAKELIQQGWCQGYFARKADGTACGSLNPDAVAWCMLGALSRACRETGGKPSDVLKVLNALKHHGELGAYNDSHTKEQVLALLDEGIANVSGSVDAG